MVPPPPFVPFNKISSCVTSRRPVSWVMCTGAALMERRSHDPPTSPYTPTRLLLPYLLRDCIAVNGEHAAVRVNLALACCLAAVKTRGITWKSHCIKGKLPLSLNFNVGVEEMRYLKVEMLCCAMRCGGASWAECSRRRHNREHENALCFYYPSSHLSKKKKSLIGAQ